MLYSLRMNSLSYNTDEFHKGLSKSVRHKCEYTCMATQI